MVRNFETIKLRNACCNIQNKNNDEIMNTIRTIIAIVNYYRHYRSS